MGKMEDCGKKADGLEALEVKSLSYVQRVKNKRDYIVRVLKKVGKYTPELSQMVGVAARALAHLDLLGEEFEKDDYAPLLVQTSREGDDRVMANPTEKMYLDYLAESRAALRGLGMSSESKTFKGSDAAAGNFLSRLSAIPND